ncbi:MAG: tyrosine-type recombinase/integrase [Saprospiraceae bacterium]|nr:tyrosine-type recombinase/integrase [Saprospiraceae bacterium]
MPWNIKKILDRAKRRNYPLYYPKKMRSKSLRMPPTYKQQVLLTFIYTTGMRLSESINVCFEDIDRHRLQIRVKKGKGNKDRFILVPPVLIDLLRDYYKKVKPIKYLFNGIHKGKPYSPRSVQLTLAQSKKLAHINKKMFYTHTTKLLCNPSSRRWHGHRDLDLPTGANQAQNRVPPFAALIMCRRHRYIKHPIDSLQIRYQPNRGIPTPIA